MIASAPFLPHFLFSLIRPINVDAIVNASLTRIFFSILPPVAANILYFLVHAIDGLGGGYRRNTSILIHSLC